MSYDSAVYLLAMLPACILCLPTIYFFIIWRQDSECKHSHLLYLTPTAHKCIIDLSEGDRSGTRITNLEDKTV